MKVLITGVSGFLGRHVARRFLADGAEVTGFDLSTSTGLEIHTITGDLTDLEAVAGAAAGQDVICHIGAIGDVYLAAEKPELAASVNVTGCASVSSAAKRHGCRVVYASTWEVYGTPRYQPIDEDHPCDPDHPYNITKLAGERMLMASHHLHGVPVVALRLGTAYGTGLRPNSVFRLFIDRARRGEPITIQGTGEQSRQFTHASDIANAFSMAAASDIAGVALNTVARESVSIKQLAESVAARIPTEVVHVEARAGDVPPAMVSSQRILDTLGWEQSVAFGDGLDELIETDGATS